MSDLNSQLQQKLSGAAPPGKGDALSKAASSLAPGAAQSFNLNEREDLWQQLKEAEGEYNFKYGGQPPPPPFAPQEPRQRHSRPAHQASQHQEVVTFRCVASVLCHCRKEIMDARQDASMYIINHVGIGWPRNDPLRFHPNVLFVTSSIQE